MRDLRDPEQLGLTLIGIKAGQGGTMGEAYDTHPGVVNRVPDYPQDELLSTVTAREYKRELEERAREGDKYAKSLLEHGETIE